MKRVTHASALRTRRAVQRKASLPPAKTRDKYEVQADTLAHRFVKGERGLGREIVPTHSAAFMLPASPGEPLPNPLRTELERAFDANLCDVRIHRDAEAASAAARERAHAFASGPSLYFGAGRFAANTVDGRELIAHEIVHVLQQTGRQTTDHRWRAVAVMGHGEIQRQHGGDPPPATPAPEDLFTALGTVYTNASSADATATVGEVRTLLNGRLPMTPGPRAAADEATRQFIDAVRQRRFRTRPPIARGFIVDCLKILGFFDDAKEILDGDSDLRIQIFYWRQEFVDHVLGTGDQRSLLWAGHGLAHADLARAWPQLIAVAYRRFFLRPHTPPLGPSTEIQRQVSDAHQRYDDAHRNHHLIPQERVVLAWDLLSALDSERVDATRELYNRYGGHSGRRVTTGAWIAMLRELHGSNRAAFDDSASTELQQNFSGMMLRVIEAALPAWEQAQQAYQELDTRIGRLSDEQLTDSTAGTGAHIPRSGLRGRLYDRIAAALTPAATALVAVGEHGELPNSQEYASRLETLRTAILSGSDGRASLVEQLDGELTTAFERNPRDRSRFTAIGTFSFVLDSLIHLSDTYDAAADDATPVLADERGAHRIRMARGLARFANWMQWPQLLAAVSPALTSARIGRVELWLIDDWTPQEAMPPSRLAEDFPGNENRAVISGTPITIRHIVDWFQYRYNVRLASLLTDILANESTASRTTNLHLEQIETLRQTREQVAAVMAESPARRHEVEQALLDHPNAQTLPSAERTFDLRTPQRFVVRDWEVVVPPGEEVDWLEEISRQPKTAELLLRHLEPGPLTPVIYPDNPLDQGMFAWVLPSIAPMVQMLRERFHVPAVSEGGPTDIDWLTSMNPAAMTVADAKTLNNRLRNIFSTALQASERPLPELWHRVSVLVRRILAMQLSHDMREFIANPTLTGGSLFESGHGAVEHRLRRFDTPARAGMALSTYQSAVMPREEAETQTVLLVLVLAEEIAGMVAKGDATRGFTQQVYPLVIMALEAIDNQDKLVDLRRGASDPLDQAGNVVMIERNLTRARDFLRAAKETAERQVAESQSTIGYRGNPQEGRAGSPEGTITPLSLHTPIYASRRPSADHTWRLHQTVDTTGHLDEATGDQYRILQVHSTFVFHPQIGNRTAATERTGAGGPLAPASIEVHDGIFRQGEEPAAPHQLLFEIQIGNARHEVYANDWALLTALNDIFLWRSFQISMQNLAAITEASMQWMMTAVGVVQPELAYAEMATNLIAMAADGQFDEIIRQIREDPFAVIERIVQRLASEFLDPAHIWRFILLGDEHNPFTVLASFLPPRSRRRTISTSRLGRVLNALRSLGSRFEASLLRVQERATGPVRGVEAALSMRPRLSWLLLRAVEIVELVIDVIPPSELERILRGLNPDASATLGPDEAADQGVFSHVIGGAQERVQETGNELRDNVGHLLQAADRFELPPELIPLDVATELIVQYVLDRFGPRARVYRMIMELFPIPQGDMGRFRGFRSLYAWLCGQIADLWRDSPVDPNVPWRETVIPRISDGFYHAKDELVGTMYDGVNGLLRLLHMDPLERQPPIPQTEVTADRLSDEAEASADDGELRESPDWTFEPVGGMPMAGAARTFFEHGFGQDFAHVRVHDGAQARSATEPIGANAITSGSHIFLRPGIQFASPAGRRLLAHELTHVVQQTGPRPLRPTVQNPTPVRGTPGLGLRIEPAREVAAEAMADRVAEGVPLSTEEIESLGAARGVQPSLGERMFEDLVRTLTEPGAAEVFERNVGETAVPGVDRARQIWQQTAQHVAQATATSFAGFMHEAPAMAAIKTLLTPPDPIVSAIPRIAQAAQHPVRNRSEGQPDTELHPGNFANLLEGFLFATRGIGLQIRLTPDDSGVASVNVVNIDLSKVPMNHALWDLAMRAFSDSTGAIRRELYQRFIVLGLTREPQPSLWHATRFEFGEGFRLDFESLERARTSTVISGLPDAAVYKTNSDRGDVLALNLHGTLTDRGIGTYKRESHHMSQFLLAKFFANQHSNKAFPAALSDEYPPAIGFASGTSGPVSQINLPGHPAIRIDVLSPGSGRGDAMPAILLAARTHRRGRLHLEREGQWNADSNEATGTATQGNTIRNWFNAALPRELRTDNTSAAHLTEMRDWKTAHPGLVDRTYYDAVVATYHRMYSRMMPQLKVGLKTEERAFYNGIAAINHGPNGVLQANWSLSEDDMVGVWNAAKSYHDGVMSGHGWPTPSTFE
jgi:uncharacterized protein DUF4157